MTNTPTYQFESCHFEGPLDVLLSLVEKHQLDIYDLPIALLVEQYLAFIHECEERDWALTADFIEMTARLLYIKSYALLPPSETEEEEDPKQELEHMLQQYAHYKSLSEDLREQYIGHSVYFREGNDETLPKPPAEFNYISDKLQNAYQRVLIKYATTKPDKGKLSTIINTSYVPVTVCVSNLNRRFARKSSYDFEDIFTECETRSEIIATFLAILELLRCGKLDMTSEGDRVILFVAEDPEKE